MTLRITQRKQTMTSADITDIQNRVNESRRMFLETLHASDEQKQEDAKKAIEEFLIHFTASTPERSQITRENATEAIQLIVSFRNVQVSFAMNAALLSGKMESVLVGLQLKVLSIIPDVLGEPLSTDGENPSPLELLNRHLKSATQAQEELAAEGQSARDMTVAVGEHVDRVQRVAATILLMRYATMSRFRREHLSVSWSELRKRLKRELAEASKAELFQKSWEVICEIGEELLDITLDETIPVKKIPRYWARFRKIVGRRDPDTTPGGTEIMNKLLEQLRREHMLFEKLEATCDEAMDALDQIDRDPSTRK